MSFAIPEMQKVKERFPQYKDVEDVTLMNAVARKYPVYKPLAAEVGERIRADRAKEHPTSTVRVPEAARLAKAARGVMRTTGMEKLKTAQHIMANADKLPQVEPGENFFSFLKRFKSATGLEQREMDIASKGTIAQFEDQMSLGIAAGMMTHPVGIMQMLGIFGALEKGADVVGINKFIENVPNVDVRDTLELIKFGVLGALAGGMTKKLSMRRAKIEMKKKAKTKAEMDAAVTVVERVIDMARKKEGKVNPKTVRKVEMTLEAALAKADKAMAKMEPKDTRKMAGTIVLDAKGQPMGTKTKITQKASAVSSKVEVKPKPTGKVVSKDRARELRKQFLEKQKAKKPKTTSPKDQVSTAEGEAVEVTLRIKGETVKKKMTSKQIFELKEQIREGATDIKLVEKAQQKAEAKATALERAADELLGERTPKDQLGDVIDVVKGVKQKGLGSTLGNVGLDAKGQQAMNRLQADAKKSGKDLGKYLKENLKMDSASVAVLVKASRSPLQSTVQIKNEKGKPTTKRELDVKSPEISDAIVQEKIRNAKSPRHADNIRRKYGVKSDTPTNNPAVTKDVPAIDPLMEKRTLFNPEDKASVRINGRINRNLDKAQRKASKNVAKGGKEAFHFNNWVDTTFAMQGVQERTGMPMYSKYYLEGVETSNKMNSDIAMIVNSFTSTLSKGKHTLEGDARIVDWITQRKGTLGAEEQRIANKLVEIFKSEQGKIKYLRMRRWIDGIGKAPKGKKKLVTQGKNILKTKGVDALEEWAATQDFGVIKNDRYLPAELIRGINLTGNQDAFSVFNPHVESRVAKTTTYDTTRSLAQKVHNYMSRVYGDYYFYDYLKSIKNELGDYNVPSVDFAGVKSWVGALQGHGIPVGPTGRFARKARGQFFKTILADPYKWGRNLLQNVAFLYQNYPLSTNIIKTVKLPFRKTSKPEREFFKTHISQLGELRKEYLYLYETKQKGPLGKIDKLATKVAEFYTKTDEANRWWSYKHALTGVEKSMRLYKQGKISYDKFAKQNGMGSFTDLEIKHVLGLEPEAAKLQIARFITEKTHVRYKKHERGIGALSELGEVGTSLLQFPRTVLSRFIDGGRMITKGRTHHERWQGAQLLIGYGVMGALANEILKRTFGTKIYYDPELRREVESQPYSLLNSITGISFGGAQTGQIKKVTHSIKLIAELVSEGSKKSFTSAKGRRRRNTIIREILKNADGLSENFIPFLKSAMNGVESLTDKQSYKLLTTSFDIMTKRRSALKRNKAERDWVDRILHTLGGTERVEDE